MRKPEIRKEYLERRMQLSPDEVSSCSERIAVRVIEHIAVTQGIIHIFLPIEKKNEPDTFVLIHKTRQSFPGLRIAVPIVERQQNLKHVIPDFPLETVTDSWGIPNPKFSTVIHPQEIDCVVVPLLAFDKTGHRVGYGKGFYDRFLRSCRKEVTLIGLSFFGPTDAIEDIQPTDVPMDACFTPEKTYVFDSERVKRKDFLNLYL